MGEILAQRLRGAGHRVTPQRRAVWDALCEADGHVTAEQLATESRAPNIGTVYRALGLFEQLGLVHSVRLSDEAPASWELAHPEDHVHLVCTGCDRVSHHVGDAVQRLRDHLVEGHGFEVSDVALVVSGHCATCRGVAGGVVPPHVPAFEAEAHG